MRLRSVASGITSAHIVTVRNGILFGLKLEGLSIGIVRQIDQEQRVDVAGLNATTVTKTRAKTVHVEGGTK